MVFILKQIRHEKHVHAACKKHPLSKMKVILLTRDMPVNKAGTMYTISQPNVVNTSVRVFKNPR